MLRNVLFLLAAAALTTTAACNFELGSSTKGDLGRLAFSYDDMKGCFFGCSTDAEALAGSVVQVSATGGDPNASLKAFSRDTSVATVTSHQSCSCDSSSGNSSTSRSVSQGEACHADETRSCSLEIEVDSKGAGDVAIEVTDAGGKTVDSTTLHFRNATSIEASVATKLAGQTSPVAAASDGTFKVRAGNDIEVTSKVHGANGDLVFSSRGFIFAYPDPSIVGPGEFEFSTDVEGMKAAAQGTGHVTLTAGGVTKDLVFVVQP